MNKFQKFLLQYEKPLKCSSITIGFSLIILGVSIHFNHFLKEWLVAIGDSYASDGNCCRCHKYIGLYIPSLIVVGSFLSFPLIFEKQIVKLYEKCVIKQNTVLATLLVLIFITLGLISYFTFHNFPYSYDEYNFLYQAKIFSQGKIFIEVPEILRPFKETYMILNDDKLFSKYPPGFSLILTIGVLLNIPGLINPLVAVLTLTITYFFTKSFLGPKYGLLSVIIMSTTPYFLGYSASYYSQPTALLLTALIFLMVRSYELTYKDNYLYLLGLVSGFLFLTRPLDSFCVIVPSYFYLIYILYKKENLKRVSCPILTFAMVFALFLTYNYILVGRITIATYPVFVGEFRVVVPASYASGGLIQNVIWIATEYISNGIKNIPELLYKYFLTQTGIFIPLFAIFGLFFYKSKWKWVLILNFLMLVIFHNFNPGLGWPQYGARYYYSGYFSLAILSTISFKQLIEKINSKNNAMYLLTFILCIHFLFTLKLFNEYSYRFKVKLAIIEDIRNNCQDNSIVILESKINNPIKSNCILRLSFGDLGGEKRNMFMNTSRLMTWKNDPHFNLSKIKSYFPNHSVCYYNYNNILNELLTYDVASND
jgi:4-amino-4-deoxy-L-arabinose transferase-like glycosyltransferase